MKRRGFLKTGAVSTATLTLAGTSTNAASLPRRKYGKTGIELSIVGFGGIVVTDKPQDYANKIVAEAIELGTNYFDVAPAYGDTEIKLGPALEPFRKDVFLACKTGKRTRDEALEELNRSLERLRTDHLDLYQMHSLKDVKKDVDVAFGKGGAMETFIEAKKQGRVRYLGFSAHSVEAAMTALDRYDFDSILFPVNYPCWYKGDFGPQVVEKAKSLGVARLGLKAMARERWKVKKNDPSRTSVSSRWYEPTVDEHESDLAVRFALSQSITSTVPPGEEKFWRKAVEIAMRFKPTTDEENQELKKLAEGLEPLFVHKSTPA